MSALQLPQGPGRYFHWIFAVSVVAMLAYAVALMPLAFGDQFEEIVRTFRHSLGQIYEFYFARTFVFFRPLEYFWRELVFLVFGEKLFAYNLFAISILVIVALLFLAHCRVQSARDAVAAAIALAALFGHHAFTASIELNQVISNLVIVVLLLVALWILESRGRWPSAIAARRGASLALATKEIGIVVPMILVLGWLVGFRGVRMPAALAVALVTGLYLSFRVYIVLGAGQIDDLSYGGQRGMASFASNVVATLLNILISEPKSGDFGTMAQGLVSGLTQPWKLVQIAAPLTSYLLIAYVAVRRKVWIRRSDPELGRYLVLLAAVVLGSALLGFFHTNDYFGVTTLPVMAAVLYRSLRLTMEEVENDAGSVARRACLVLCLMVLSTSWTLRLPADFFFVRDLSAAIQEDWVENIEAYRQRAQRPYHEDYLRRFREHAMGTPMATQGHLDQRLRRWFGDRSGIAR